MPVGLFLLLVLAAVFLLSRRAHLFWLLALLIFSSFFGLFSASTVESVRVFGTEYLNAPVVGWIPPMCILILLFASERGVLDGGKVVPLGEWSALFALYVLAITVYIYIPPPWSLFVALANFVAGVILIGVAPIFVFVRYRHWRHR